MTDGGGADFGRVGALVGHATDAAGATGCTVVRGAAGALRGAAAVVGRATGTRELALLEPGHLVERVDALLLTGGSAYGLDAAAGVMEWCEARGEGFPVGAGVVPIVPAATIFDLAPLGRFDARPTAAMARAACDAARATGIAEGSVGAGTGATVGKLLGPARATKGGVGCALLTAEGDLAVAAVAVVNAFGEVRDARGRTIAGVRGDDGGFLDATALLAEGESRGRFADAAGRNTTIAAVIVGVPLAKLALAGVARAAAAALHRRIVPAGSPFDGDVVFALAPTGWPGAGGPPRHQHDAAPDAARHPDAATRRVAPPPGGIVPDPALALRIEALATAALEQAIERAVRLARGRDGVPGLADANPRDTTA